MIAYNWTSAQKRDKKVYSLFDVQFSQSGISVRSLQCIGLALVVFLPFGLLTCWATGTFWYNPLLFMMGTRFMPIFWSMFIFAPIAAGIALDRVRVQSYRLIDFIKMILQPKRSINASSRPVRLEKIKFNGFVRRL